MSAIILSLSIGIVSSIVIFMLIKTFLPLLLRIKNHSKNHSFNSTYSMITATLFVFVLTLYIFKNLVPALIAAIIVVILPSQIHYWKQKKVKTETLEQLATATQLFSNEYEVTRSIPKSLNIVAERIPDPVGKIFRKAYSGLAMGEPQKKVFDTMARELKISYGIMFVQLLRSMHNQGDIILPLMNSLVARIRIAQEQENLKSTETTGDRNFNIVLLFLPIPMFFVLQRVIPQISTFLADTFAGRFLFTLWLLSIIIWFFIDRMVTDY